MLQNGGENVFRHLAFRLVFGCACPVSYTHLDVYKRQSLRYFRIGAMRTTRGGQKLLTADAPLLSRSSSPPGTVGRMRTVGNMRRSLTITSDVYKRQAIESAEKPSTWRKRGTDLPGFPTFRQAPGQSRNCLLYTSWLRRLHRAPWCQIEVARY